MGLSLYRGLGHIGLYRKIAITIIILIFVYIIYRLLQKRHEIIQQSSSKTIEGFTPTDSNVLAIQKSNTINPNIENMPANFYSKPLNHFYIMSAYGGAFDGYDTCDDMMLYTLSLGYRYVFINVFFDVVNNPLNKTVTTSPTAMVGFSSLYSPMDNIAGNTIALSDLIDLLTQNAFSSPYSPNPNDPFFLHILPAYKTGQAKDETTKQQNKGYNTQLNSQIEQALSLLQNTNRSSGKINAQTPLSKIQGQLVIVMDGASTAGNMTTNLQNMIGLNIPTSSFMMASTFQNSSSDTSNGLNIVLPFDENGSVLNSIPPYNELFLKNKLNITPVLPWEPQFIFSMSSLGPSNLGEYVKMFYTEGNTAFIPLS